MAGQPLLPDSRHPSSAVGWAVRHRVGEHVFRAVAIAEVESRTTAPGRPGSAQHRWTTRPRHLPGELQVWRIHIHRCIRWMARTVRCPRRPSVAPIVGRCPHRRRQQHLRATPLRPRHSCASRWIGAIAAEKVRAASRTNAGSCSSCSRSASGFYTATSGGCHWEAAVRHAPRRLVQDILTPFDRARPEFWLKQPRGIVRRRRERCGADSACTMLCCPFTSPWRMMTSASVGQRGSLRHLFQDIEVD